MTELREFLVLNFKITWTLIDIGYRGSDIFYGELQPIEIINYAISLLEEDCFDEEVVELACEDERNIDEINKYVKNLSEKETNADKNLEMKKWMVCYVNKNLQYKYDNYIEGLIELGDIWVKLGMPKNCPHVFQGVDNNILPGDYYTQQNYDDLYRRHTSWIIKTIGEINSE